MKNSWEQMIKKLHNDLRYYFCMLFTPRFRREELQHTERKCVRHLKLTPTLCEIIQAIIYHELLTSVDE